MSFAKLRYTPAGFSTVDIDFPEELSAWEGPIRNAERQVNETEAGVMMVHFGHFEEQCVAVLEKVPFSENFVNQVRAFWTHATRGGKFSFYRDGAKIGVTTIRAAAAAGSNLVLLNGFSFFAGHRVVLESAVDGWQQEACLVAVQNPSSPPSDQMTSPLIFDWAIGDVARAEFAFKDCVLVDDAWPINEEGNGLQMTLRLRFKTFAGRAIVAEPA